MKQLTEEQLLDNWAKLQKLIEDTFEGERKEKLLEMYKYFEDRMIVAPASGKEEFHYCYAGGYVNHVLHVVETALEVSKTYEKVGGHKNWTDEELIFSAMHHDLGKVGDLDGEYYIPQDNEWRRKTLGEVFTHNKDIQSMRVTDRALFLLQHFDIKINLNETLAIKLSDGMYDEAAPYYLKVFDASRSLKNCLPNIIHWADHMATMAEYDEWRLEDEDNKEEMDARIERIKNISVGKKESKPKPKEEKKSKHADLFDELFGES